MARVVSLRRQCHATLPGGQRCSITDATTSIDRKTKLCAGMPLQRGALYCSYHAKFFVERPITAIETTELFFLDFETTGLSIIADHIIEAALLNSHNAAFATTICPAKEFENTAIHGICYEETLQSPSFVEAFARILAFMQSVLDTALEEDDDSSSEDIPRQPMLATTRPRALIIAHNGYKFDFPMLLSECIRSNTELGLFADCLYVDSLLIVRALDAEMYGGCPKLQCLMNKFAYSGCLRAHRALDDCLALREIMLHIANGLGLPLATLLNMFAVEMDYEASAMQLGSML